MNHDELVKCVVQWRTALRLPQWEVARRVNVPRGTYALWEQGRGRLPTRALQRLVAVLNRSRGTGADPLVFDEPKVPKKEPKLKKPRKVPKPRAAAHVPHTHTQPIRIPVGTPALHRAAMSVLVAHPKAKLDPKNFIHSYAAIVNALDGS